MILYAISWLWFVWIVCVRLSKSWLLICLTWLWFGWLRLTNVPLGYFKGAYNAGISKAAMILKTWFVKFSIFVLALKMFFSFCNFETNFCMKKIKKIMLWIICRMFEILTVFYSQNKTVNKRVKTGNLITTVFRKTKRKNILWYKLKPETSDEKNVFIDIPKRFAADFVTSVMVMKKA